MLDTHNGTLLANNTYSGGLAVHIFFDQDLVTSVKKTPAYAANSQELTINADDGIFTEASAFDSVVAKYLHQLTLADRIEKL